MLLPWQSWGATALYLGREYQAGASGTIRTGNPAGDSAFTSWLATANLTPADVSPTTGAAPKAVWGKFSTAATNASSYTYTIGSTSVVAGISGWNDLTNAPSVSGSATLSTFGLNSTTMQASAPRPGFASGAGSGYYLGTNGGSSSDRVRNGVSFDLSAFDGGGVYSFGIFGGDLETGATGSPVGFLLLTYTDNSTERIDYTPDSTLFPNVSYSGNNNVSETYGNSTSRFIGLASDDKRIKAALFVVGDDDLNDNGDSEQLSFIGSGITFLDASGKPLVPGNVPVIPIPEPGSAFLAALGLLSASALRKRRNQRSS